MWRIKVIGISLSVSLAICIVLDLLTMQQVMTHEAILNDDDSEATAMHWLEFAANIAPGITILFAYKAQDVFGEFNKFPEHCPRVSVI